VTTSLLRAPRRDTTRRGAAARGGRPRRRPGRGWPRVLLAVLIGVAFIFPFYWTVVISLARPGGFDSYPPLLWPQWDWANWARAWGEAPWIRLFLNTVLIASSTVIFWLAPQVSPFQPVRVTMPWMPINGANGPGPKSEPAAAVMPEAARGLVVPIKLADTGNPATAKPPSSAEPPSSSDDGVAIFVRGKEMPKELLALREKKKGTAD